MNLNFCGTCIAIALSLLCCSANCLAQVSSKSSGRVGAVDIDEPDAPSHQSQNLSEALVAFQQQLIRDHQQQFSPLLTKQSVLSAIRVTHQHYKANKSFLQGVLPGHYYQENLDLMRQITSGGPWPKGAYLSGFYGLTDAKGVTYRGIGVRLNIRDPQHPSQQLIGSSWPILDVWYGHGE